MIPPDATSDFVLEVAAQSAPRAATAHTPAAGTAGLCRLRVTPERTEITTDSGGLYAVFADLEKGIFSSSLRTVLRRGGTYLLNREALCEQLVTGAVSGRETCLQGIDRVDGSGEVSTSGVHVLLNRLAVDRERIPAHCRDVGSCVDVQLQTLRAHFREIGAIAGDGGVSMGLSGGYDSRLMLLLALEAGIPVHPFTFSSAQHVHERGIAAQLASLAGLELREIPVRLPDDLDESELEANIEDAISYYDGRTNDTMGTFADVHTARVQRECLGEAAVNLNGLGGELYRNRERLPRYRSSFDDWFWHYVVGPVGFQAFSSAEARMGFQQRTAAKYGRLLEQDRLTRIDRALARRWYRDVWLPYFAGPRLSAENRVGPALMPFADGAVSAAALAATPCIGPHGGLEAAMIRRLDEQMAAVPSSYGYGFGRRRLSRRILDVAAALVPLPARRARHRLRNRPRDGDTVSTDRWRRRFAEPLQLLRSIGLPLSLDVLLDHQVSRDRTLYIAEFLYRHRAHIDMN